MNVGSGIVQAFSEGSTLAVVFWAVEALSASPGKSVDWSAVPIFSIIPGALGFVSSLPTNAVFLLLLTLAVALQALQSLAAFANSVSVGYFAARCTALVKARIHSQVLSFTFPCASGYRIGDLTNYAATGPSAVETQIGALSHLVVTALMMTAYIVVLVAISPWLLLAVIVMGGLIAILQRYMLPRIVGGSRQLNALEVAISQRVTEDFQALRLLHSSGQLDEADRHLRGRMSELEQSRRAQTRRSSLVGPISSLLPILAIALIASFSLLLFNDQSAALLPSLVTFILALQRLNQRTSGIAGTLNTLANNTAKVERLNGILSHEGKKFRRLGGIPFATLQRSISFSHVSLQYAPDIEPALSDICFTLPKGQVLALVGPSGAGKSSIADLLNGLYAPSKGTILIDGQPLESFELASWQKRLGVVSQDTFLFNATIAENISFGMPEATPQQIDEACQAALASGFIHSLPKGYDTLVGERGYRLSGGQRQRLSLARAILREPELLILDEATSALDSQSERLVQQAIERYERNHTVLVIAHRLSTIVAANQIIVLDRGRIVESGTHSVLIEKKGLYSQLWQHQSQGIS